MNILKYKDYEGTAELDMEKMLCRGKILFIDDLVTYVANTPAELKKEFEAAVEDYLETCKFLKREAKKPLKGLFNVRMSPALHKDLVMAACAEDRSLNDVVVVACSAYVRAQTIVNNVQVNISVTKPVHTAQIAGLPPEAKWSPMHVH